MYLKELENDGFRGEEFEGLVFSHLFNVGKRIWVVELDKNDSFTVESYPTRNVSLWSNLQFNGSPNKTFDLLYYNINNIRDKRRNHYAVIYFKDHVNLFFYKESELLFLDYLDLKLGSDIFSNPNQLKEIIIENL
jgi:hypothetical protein